MLIDSACSPAIWGGHFTSHTESRLPYQNRYRSNTTHLPLFDIKAQLRQQNTPPYQSSMPSLQPHPNHLRTFQSTSTTPSEALNMPQQLSQQSSAMEWPMLSPYGPDYDGTSTSFFQVRLNILGGIDPMPIDRTQLISTRQYELTGSEDNTACSNSNDVPASDAVPSMTNSPLQSAASSDACPSPNKTRESSLCGDFPGLDSPFESGVTIKGNSTDLCLNASQQMHEPTGLPYVNSPWDAPHSQKMMVVDSPVSSGHSAPQSLEYSHGSKLDIYNEAALDLTPFPTSSTGVATRQQYECPSVDMMYDANIKCEPLTFNPHSSWSQQHGLPITASSAVLNDAIILSNGGHQIMAPLMTQQHSLPVSPTQFASPTSEPYMYYPKIEQDINSLSAYPMPPGPNPMTDCAGTSIYGMVPKQMSDREHCNKMLQCRLQQAASLRQSRENSKSYNSQRLLGQTRRFLDDAYSPRPASSPADSDFDDNCEGVVVGGAERSARDEYLLKWRNRGWTYKEIRDKGQFAEAESTLRGRYRTLTKEKEARVRKPEWQDKDIKLLKQAVKKFSKNGSNGDVKKISWKQVAEYIYQNGGSYSFGYATCRKRWDEIVARKED